MTSAPRSSSQLQYSNSTHPPQDMEPTLENSESLDLHEIALLLNYQRASTEPRFRYAKLREIANNEINFQTVKLTNQIWDRHTGDKLGFVFDIRPPKNVQAEAEPDLPSNMLPDPVPLNLQLYSEKELETIYWQSRSHNGSFLCAALIQIFFDQYPPNTPLRIRTSGGEDYITEISTRVILEMDLMQPRMMTTSLILPKNLALFLGESPTLRYAVVGFSHSPTGNVDTVLDMAAMQLGDGGRGLNGRGTFVLESLDAFYDRLEKLVYGADTENAKTSQRVHNYPEGAWLEEIAKRVKERWEKRETEPWCGHCGIPGRLRELKKCSGCRNAQYCSRTHQMAAWPLHKRYCMKKD